MSSRPPSSSTSSRQGLDEHELEDLLELAVNGEIREPASPLGEHVNENWEELVGPSNKSLVHWMRRLVFRGAWLDQRVKEGELDIVFDEGSQTFGYVQPDRDSELIELSAEPSWARHRLRRPRPGLGSELRRTQPLQQQLGVRASCESIRSAERCAPPRPGPSRSAPRAARGPP